MSNRPYASHAWLTNGDYVVTLRAYNESFPGGVAASVTIHVVTPPAVHYVAVDSSSPVSPYSSWAAAATNIQDAVDAAAVPWALVLVSNGVYQAGSRAVYGMGNRVAVTKPVTVQSVNGAAVTSIVGYQVPGATNGAAAVRCVYLTNGALLAGFTVTNGATQTSGDQFRQMSGGGVWCESASAVVSNCVLTGNSAYYGGGGTYFGTLTNCLLTNNVSLVQGGGAYNAVLEACTISSNLAGAYGGGAYGGTLNNCTIIGNAATNSSGQGGGVCQAALNNCTLMGNHASQYGGGACGGFLVACMLTNNAAQNGGGVAGGTLINCTLASNTAHSDYSLGAAGGGAYGCPPGAYCSDGPQVCTLINCTLVGNQALGLDPDCGNTFGSGGGASGVTLTNCSLSGNFAEDGGGAIESTLIDCTLVTNVGGFEGGGAAYSTLARCTLLTNSAYGNGGGVSGGTLSNCALIGNSAYSEGGGASYATLINCTLVGNSTHG